MGVGCNDDGDDAKTDDVDASDGDAGDVDDR